MQKGGSCHYSTPKKFTNLSDTIKFESAPRKLRSALEKRHHESRKPRKETDGSVWKFKDCTKKYKATADGYKDSNKSVVTKDEEEAAQALFALAQTVDSCLNKACEVERASMQMVAVNEGEESDVKVTHKRCLVHVYICKFIQESEGGHVNVISDINSICSH